MAQLAANPASGASPLCFCPLPGLALLTDASPQDVLPFLLGQYAGAPMAETRMKVGEALLRTTRALGESACRGWECQVFLGAREAGAGRGLSGVFGHSPPPEIQSRKGSVRP